MIEYKGIYLPEGETHLIEWMETVAARPDAAKFHPIIGGKPTYQAHKYMAALKYCRQRRVAVDVGAHAGLWSRIMALDFQQLVAFEPVAEHVKCWHKNLETAHNARLYRVACGEKRQIVSMHTRTPGSSGDTSVARSEDEPNAAERVSMVLLDDYGLKNVDFLKIDNEGYELYGLRGAEATLLRCRPVVIVEQKPGMAQRFGLPERGAVEYLQSLGAKLREGIQGDYVLSWD